MKNYSGFESCYLLEGLNFLVADRVWTAHLDPAVGWGDLKLCFRLCEGHLFWFPLSLGIAYRVSAETSTFPLMGPKFQLLLPQIYGTAKIIASLFLNLFAGASSKTSLLILFCNEAFPDHLPYGISHHYHSFYVSIYGKIPIYALHSVFPNVNTLHITVHLSGLRNKYWYIINN